MQPKLLLICPTRERPEMFKRMLDSLRDTATIRIVLVALMDYDEPLVNEYFKYFKMTVTKSKVTPSINLAFNLFSGFDYYSVTNDDFIYKTKGWDKRLMDQAGDWGISFGDDLSGTKIPTTSVVGGKLARAIGWLQLPGLQHLYGDMVWQHIGHELKCLKYCPDVITEHCHYLNKKNDKRLYQRTNNPNVYAHDQAIFRVWRDSQCKHDIERVRHEKEKAEKRCCN